MTRRGNNRNRRGLLVAAVLVALVAAGLVAGQGREGDPRSVETLDHVEPGAVPESASFLRPWVEPQQRAEAELRAVEAARDGKPFEDTPVSPAVARMIERLRQAPVPAGEVFALFKVTDRLTGERRVLTRGTPDPRIADYLEDPSLAPDGRVYAEADEAWAADGVEVALRAVFVGDDDGEGPTLSAEQEEERELRERNVGGGLSFRIDSGLRELILGGAIDPAAEEPGPLVPVMIELRDVPSLRLPKSADPAGGGLLWAGLDVQAERERRIIQRKQRLADLQRPLIRAVEQVGGRVEYASWTSGSIQTLLPAAAIPLLVEHPAVFSLEHIPEAETHGHRYLGDDIHLATNAEDYQWHTGWNGLSSKHSYTSRIVLAMSEECVTQTSPAWRTAGPSSSSRGRFYDIDPNSGYTLGGLEACVNDTSHGGTGHASHRHGHWVLGNMAADFMDGQEAVLTTSERRQRTGTCEECFFLFGQDWNLNERSRAHDWACDKGADIFQSSIGFGNSCDGNGSLDGNIQSLINCDAVYVQSAGNNGSTGGSCTTGYPADHPWTFAVGGIATEDPCDTATEYYTTTCQYDGGASRGGATYDGCGGCADVVDLAGPYRVCHALDPNTANPTQRQCVTGTSFASPIVAGLMARTMDWYRQHVSTSIFYDNRARNWMLLMGDRSANFSGGSQWLNTTDPRWGAGRVRLVPFDDLGCWSIFRGSVTLSRGSSFTFNDSVPGCGRIYKVVVWHTGKDYSNEPMIRLTINPSGCGTATSSVDRLDSKTMLKTQLSGCSNVAITVRNIGVGFSGTRKFHVAAYTDGGTSDRTF